jgi:Flp pilus assembly protein TadG
VSRSYNEEGAGALETAIVAPAVLLLLVAVLQAALWWHANHVALAAAQQGATVAASQGPVAGRTAATDFARSAGLDDPAATADGSAGSATVTVTVTGRAPGLIPGFSPAVHASAAAPTENYEHP